MRLIVTGHARHGKDTVCELLVQKLGLKFTSSSAFVAERAVRPWLEQKCGLVYSSYDDMYADRVNHRADWYNAISDYCKDDAARLGRELFEAGNDIYCGLRNRRELLAMKEHKIIDATIWVDASCRCPSEPTSSISILPTDADYVINNNGPLRWLDDEVQALIYYCDGVRYK